MNKLWIRVVDADFRPVKGVEVRAVTAKREEIRLNYHAEEAGRSEEITASKTAALDSPAGRWEGAVEAGSHVTIYASAEGFESETHDLFVREEVTQVVIGLRRPGELSYTYGNDRLALAPVEDAYLLHVEGKGAADKFAKIAKKLQLKWSEVSEGKKGEVASDEIFVRVEDKGDKSAELSRELERSKLQNEISRIISHGERLPLGLTNELVVRFQDDVKRAEAERLARSVEMQIARELHHAGNAFLLVGGGSPSYDLLKRAEALLKSGRVIYVEPNLRFSVQTDVYTPNDFLWGQLPHLPLIDVDDAWDLMDNVSVNLRGGSPNITVGVIDPHGITPNHPDLIASLTDGTGKLISTTNFAVSPVVAQTVAGLGGDHGTQCAGSATAAFDNNIGTAGVAPNCHLIGARIGSYTNTVLMADVYLWVGGFLNGSTTPGFPAAPPTQAADVISSSWGVNGLAMSNTIRDCFDFLTTYGRGGKGCVLCFSLGNNGYVDFTNAAGTRFRAWPTYEKTIAVGSSINTNPTNPIPVSIHADPNGNTNNVAVAVDRRALYSPYGATALRKPDLVSPSHTAYDGGGNLIDPILSTFRVGTGAVDGCPGAPTCNDYDFSFGGTSHSTPTVAGAVALILSARSDLNWVQVRDILRQSCARIDAAQANAIGQWQDLNVDGQIDYSRWYGAGRLDVDAAITLALDPSLPLADIYVRENLADTGDVPSGGTWWASPDIWVRQNAAEGIPALAWGSAPPHQNARRGQDNAIFCRVRNRGGVAAPVVYVRAMITHWAGLEFTYPGNFQPSNNVGSPVPNPLVPGTYLIGEVRIDNLAAGADQIVKINWPQGMIPPENVVVNGANVHWHPCLLLEASPHDGPNAVVGPSAPVQGNNNIAQRNITILNAGDASADNFVGMIAGTADKVGVATLILDASLLRGEQTIKLHIADEKIMKQFITSLRRVVKEEYESDCDDREKGGVVIEGYTRLRISCCDRDTVIEAAPGTRIISGCCEEKGGVTAGVTQHQEIDAVEIKGLRRTIEIPLRLSGGEYVPLLIALTGPGTGDLRITQRRGDGELSAGYGVRKTSEG